MKKQLLSIMLVITIIVTALSVPAFALEPLKLTVSSETASAGEDVQVTISVANNTGLASLKFDVAYDSALTLKSVTFDSDFGTWVTAPEPFKNPEPLTMISPLSDITANGEFATLTFTVKEGTPNGYKANVTISYREKDIFDGDFTPVATTVVNGTVTVKASANCPHSYDNACDTDCNECGETRTTEHVYDNACDKECNECGHTRTVSNHVYDNRCDADCNVCGETHEVGNHYYTDDKDISCNECGHKRVVEGAPAFVVESKNVKAGETFTIDVSIKNNSGIVGLRTYVGYDENVLELVSITAGADFMDTSFGPLTQNPISVLWDDSLAASNNTTNGTVATLTFKVKEDAEAGDTAITLNYEAEDVYDYNWDNVEFAVENGKVTITEYISGDVNGDGNVNNKDLGLLRRSLNGWEVEIDRAASDVNRDDNVNNKDLGILRRYLNGWDVELK